MNVTNCTNRLPFIGQRLAQKIQEIGQIYYFCFVDPEVVTDDSY